MANKTSEVSGKSFVDTSYAVLSKNAVVQRPRETSEVWTLLLTPLFMLLESLRGPRGNFAQLLV